jgi:tRNA-splicing ligase RtcB
MANREFKLKRLDDTRWEIPREGRMNVPGLLYTSARKVEELDKDDAPRQVYNVAHLPGIVRSSIAMPDMHWGYGFPIGGVAAFGMDGGVVSPGGVGYDINCGVRMMVTGADVQSTRPRLRDLVEALFVRTPCGLGGSGGMKLSGKELSEVIRLGASWVVDKLHMGSDRDLERIEDSGRITRPDGTLIDPSAISPRAYERGRTQLGTLGSGNHFLEVAYVDEVFDESIARQWGLEPGRVTITLHTGSRGFGYQICDEFVSKLTKEATKLKVYIPDKQLAFARLGSDKADEYMNAMAAAANYAFANRQVLMYNAKEAWDKVMRGVPHGDQFRLLYDVCHNIAKVERHTVNGKKMDLCVHRKGATRALPPGHPSLSREFRSTGQPVLVPGDMGTASYILAGAEGSEETFYSACHGAGRQLSRSRAKKAAKGRAIERELEDRGIVVRSVGKNTLKEEHPEAYKNVSEVVEVVHNAGIALKVAKLRPMGVIKG